MKIQWSRAAADDLTAIRDYISQQSARYGQRMAKRILIRARQLGKFPYSGQIVPE